MPETYANLRDVRYEVLDETDGVVALVIERLTEDAEVWDDPQATYEIEPGVIIRAWRANRTTFIVCDDREPAREWLRIDRRDGRELSTTLAQWWINDIRYQRG